MSIPPMGDIPLERHDAEDQFIRVEQGRAWAIVGPTEQQLNQQWILEEDDVLLIPKGYAHYINIGKGFCVLFGGKRGSGKTIRLTNIQIYIRMKLIKWMFEC